MNAVFAPLSFALVILLTLGYEQPIRRLLNKKSGDGPLPEGLEAKARKRLLNEPFFLIALDMAPWLSAALLAPLILWNSVARTGSPIHWWGTRSTWPPGSRN